MKNTILVLTISMASVFGSDSTFYIEKLNGEILKGDSKYIKINIIQKGYLVNSDTVLFKEAKRIVNSDGIFWPLPSKIGSDKIAKLDKKGRLVDLYSINELDISMQPDWSSSGQPPDPMGIFWMNLFKSDEYMYEKNPGNLLKLNYGNAVRDFSDNEGSMKILNSYKNWRMVQYLSFIAGIGIGAGVMTMGMSAKDKTVITIGGSIALGSLITGIICFKSKEDHLKNAVDKYNSPP